MLNGEYWESVSTPEGSPNISTKKKSLPIRNKRRIRGTNWIACSFVLAMAETAIPITIPKSPIMNRERIMSAGFPYTMPYWAARYYKLI